VVFQNVDIYLLALSGGNQGVAMRLLGYSDWSPHQGVILLLLGSLSPDSCYAVSWLFRLIINTIHLLSFSAGSPGRCYEVTRLFCLVTREMLCCC